MLTCVIATAQPHYRLTDLGTLQGGTFSQPSAVNSNGVIAGVSTAADGNQHAVLWTNGKITDIGARGLGGRNTGAFGVNDNGQAAVAAELAQTDPNNENFCGYGTGLQCVAALLQNGVLTPLATLGGYNAGIGNINSRGEIAGFAETGVRDPDCPSGAAPNGTGPQILGYEGVVWGPSPGQIRRLRPLPGDTVSAALWINDRGQAVGESGTCSTNVLPPIADGQHAVYWDTDGSVHDIGSLGGTVDAAILGRGNVGLFISNQGQVVGTATLKDNTANHAFLWSRLAGIQDIGTLVGDAGSAGLGVNDAGQVVGQSFGEGGPFEGNPRAFLWQSGVMTDLNTLVGLDAPLYLVLASGIDNKGQILGLGVTGSGDIHAFLAVPAITAAVASPKDAVTVARSMQLDGTQSVSADGKPLTYTWSIPRGYPQASISAGTTASPTVQFGQTRGIYRFQLTVTDSSGKSSVDFAVVDFEGN